jgi:hypothetical protein
MSRKVIIKALLPHRDTISTMTVSPRLSRAKLYISGAEECMPQVSNPGKKARFARRYVRHREAGLGRAGAYARLRPA